MTVQELKSFFVKGRAKAYAWPGGYPMFYVTTDGEALCPDCLTRDRESAFRSTHEKLRDGWEIAGGDVNYENPDLYCDQCSKRIESAYAEDEVGE